PHLWGGVGEADGGAPGCLQPGSVLPISGRCRRSRRRGCGMFTAWLCPPHLWGGVGEADGGAAGCLQPGSVLPIYGEVSAKPTEGLRGLNTLAWRSAETKPLFRDGSSTDFRFATHADFNDWNRIAGVDSTARPKT